MVLHCRVRFACVPSPECHSISQVSPCGVLSKGCGDVCPVYKLPFVCCSYCCFCGCPSSQDHLPLLPFHPVGQRPDIPGGSGGNAAHLLGHCIDGECCKLAGWRCSSWRVVEWLLTSGQCAVGISCLASACRTLASNSYTLCTAGAHSS